MSRRRAGYNDRLATRFTDTASGPISRHRARHPLSSRRRALELGHASRIRKPSPASSSHASVSPPPESVDNRRVLAPLHFNLRRLPSRLALVEKEPMRGSSGAGSIQIGSKRKLSGAENASSIRSRSQARSKRRRGSFGSVSTDEDGRSVMDVDAGAPGRPGQVDSDGDAFESSAYSCLNSRPSGLITYFSARVFHHRST